MGAFARYEDIRDRLPRGVRATGTRAISDISCIAPEFDGFLFDAFGVLNVGEGAIPGAVGRVRDLRAAGKVVRVVTNAASYPRDGAVEKFRQLGFDFGREEVVSSRDVAARRLLSIMPDGIWAAIAAPGDDLRDFAGNVANLGTDSGLLDRADGILFLSTACWSTPKQNALVESLRRFPRPVVIANVDLVAPRENGLTVEPGYWGHDIIDRTECRPVFFGKPYRDVFDAATEGIDGLRLAMIGDSLHTDILGAGTAGHRTVLVSSHGLLAGLDIVRLTEVSGIRPDFVAATT